MTRKFFNSKANQEVAKALKSKNEKLKRRLARIELEKRLLQLEKQRAAIDKVAEYLASKL